MNIREIQTSVVVPLASDGNAGMVSPGHTMEVDSNGVMNVKKGVLDNLAGKSSYLYIAYALDSQGNGFSLFPSESLAYINMLVSSHEIKNLQVNDFDASRWVRYIGGEASNGNSVLIAPAFNLSLSNPIGGGGLGGGLNILNIPVFTSIGTAIVPGIDVTTIGGGI